MCEPTLHGNDVIKHEAEVDPIFSGNPELGISVETVSGIETSGCQSYLGSFRSGNFPVKKPAAAETQVSENFRVVVFGRGNFRFEQRQDLLAASVGDELVQGFEPRTQVFGSAGAW